jgi:hypothetical protein
MISNIDIYDFANVLILEYGEDAALEATHYADAMLEGGDLEGLAVWKRTLAAIWEIRRTEPAEDEATH